MAEISTSILSVKEDATKIFYNLETAKTDYFHIDVMDGKFVENNNFELMKDYALTLKHITNIPLDVHFMVQNVKEFVDEFIEIEPHIITFQIEAVKSKEEILELIKYIKQNGIKVGLAVNSNTDIEKVYEFLPYIHQVLVMTVEAGKGGQKLKEENILKIKKLSEYAKSQNIEIDIEADGGINIDNVSYVKEAGANIIVSGNYIISSENYAETIKKLKNI